MGSMGDPLPSASSTTTTITTTTRPRILFIDAYDSFSNNITSLLSTLLDVEVLVLPIDSPISKDAFRHELAHYQAVVCGPGPGSPENKTDVGLMEWLWELESDELVPVLGVCLGFQSLVLACGGKVRRLRRGLHGMVRTIDHVSQSSAPETRGDNIFEGVASFKATLYHSLCADIGQDAISDWKENRWHPVPSHEDIIPLAWVEEDRGPKQTTERILMAVKHRTKPFWGVQYHPESVCTGVEGNKVVKNWFGEALQWNLQHERVIRTDASSILGRNAVRQSLLRRLVPINAKRADEPNLRDESLDRMNYVAMLQSQSLPLPNGIEVPDIAEILNAMNTNHIILDSANGNQPPPATGVDVRGRFGIIAVDVDACLRIEYHTGDSFATAWNARGYRLCEHVPHGPGGYRRCEPVPLRPGQSIWHFLAEFQESTGNALPVSVPDENEVPFLGGFVGYVTYEQGLSDIDVPLRRDRGHKRPDVCMAWVTKSIVVDHEKQLLHIQSLEGDEEWVNAIAAKLEGSQSWRLGHHDQDSLNPGYLSSSPTRVKTVIQKPQQVKYEAKVRMCQEYIAAGDSYELCLTDQTKITRTFAPPSQTGGSETTKSAADMTSDASWRLYRTLRRRNPAPFASYLRLGGATLVSSSPERFLAYNRAGLCSMKPMKGTVRKAGEPGPGCATTLAEAEAILHVPKEAAENLMIVDLVRHDLHGICGAGMVTVPDLLKVEEYQTVYTMITRVEGQLPRPDAGADADAAPETGMGTKYSGLDVLAASLPPGSMTGAPKKRSCEILQQIEDGKERSLYSGVVGYMCVTGRGDWSVTIRSIFRWDDECEADNGQHEGGGGGGGGGGLGKETWHIGAGGAVTILSTPEGEREEMFVKLARPLSIFTEDA